MRELAALQGQHQRLADSGTCQWLWPIRTAGCQPLAHLALRQQNGFPGCESCSIIFSSLSSPKVGFSQKLPHHNRSLWEKDSIAGYFTECGTPQDSMQGSIMGPSKESQLEHGWPRTAGVHSLHYETDKGDGLAGERSVAHQCSGWAAFPRHEENGRVMRGGLEDCSEGALVGGKVVGILWRNGQPTGIVGTPAEKTRRRSQLVPWRTCGGGTLRQGAQPKDTWAG